MKNFNIYQEFWKAIYESLENSLRDEKDFFPSSVHYNIWLKNGNRLSFYHMSCRNTIVENPEHVECAYMGDVPPKSITGDDECFAMDHETMMMDIANVLTTNEVNWDKTFIEVFNHIDGGLMKDYSFKGFITYSAYEAMIKNLKDLFTKINN
jgi:hypothetical protein